MQPQPPRIFSAQDILSGRISLDGYPLRYIYVAASFGSMFSAQSTYRFVARDKEPAEQMLSAVEFLETRGWEVVTVDIKAHVTCMRQVLRH